VRPERRTAAALALGFLLSPAATAQIYTRVNGNGVVEATNVPEAAGFRLTYPGKGTLIHSRGFRGVYAGEYDQHIDAAASLWGVSPALVRAVIQVESEFDRNAVSSKGAQGLMQLMPFTARRFGVLDPFDARQNVFAGVQYLRWLLDMFGGDLSQALAGYNAGENAVVRYRGVPPYKETQNYVRKIHSLLSSGFRAYTSRTSAPSTSAAPSTVPAASYAPDVVRSARTAGAKPAARLPPAQPRVYYRFLDERGVSSVSEDLPPEGVTYSLIRATGR
jgi:hypothetical protein